MTQVQLISLFVSPEQFLFAFICETYTPLSILISVENRYILIKDVHILSKWTKAREVNQVPLKNFKPQSLKVPNTNFPQN